MPLALYLPLRPSSKLPPPPPLLLSLSPCRSLSLFRPDYLPNSLLLFLLPSLLSRYRPNSLLLFLLSSLLSPRCSLSLSLSRLGCCPRSTRRRPISLPPPLSALSLPTILSPTQAATQASPATAPCRPGSISPSLFSLVARSSSTTIALLLPRLHLSLPPSSLSWLAGAPPALAPSLPPSLPPSSLSWPARALPTAQALPAIALLPPQLHLSLLPSSLSWPSKGSSAQAAALPPSFSSSFPRLPSAPGSCLPPSLFALVTE